MSGSWSARIEELQARVEGLERWLDECKKDTLFVKGERERAEAERDDLNTSNQINQAALERAEARVEELERHAEGVDRVTARMRRAEAAIRAAISELDSWLPSTSSTKLRETLAAALSEEPRMVGDRETPLTREWNERERKRVSEEPRT